VWFGGLTDRFNMLVPPFNSAFNTGSSYQPLNNTPCNFANQFNVNACSFGATTAAPDGSAAPSIVEDSSNGQHLIWSTIYTFSGGKHTTVLRFSAFLKANGRRAGLQVFTDQFGFGTYGVRVVFDLAGGRIGVPAAAFTTGSSSQDYTLVGSEICPFGNGWYRCSLDFTFTSNQTYLAAIIFLDNGIGTGALSNSYAGNGASGAFAWKTNMNPVALSTLNRTSFFDDFNSLSTIDLNNTKASNFQWFLNNFWTTWITTTPVSPSNWFAISAPSILTISPNTHGGSAMMMMSTVETSPGNFVGQTFRAPFLLEFKIAYPSSSPPWSFFSTIWSSNQEWISAVGATAGATRLVGKEFDWVELIAADANNVHENNSHILMGYPNTQGGPGSTAKPGAPLYNSNIVYAPGVQVTSGGSIYSANTSVPINTPPPAAQWNLVTWPGGGAQLPNIPFDYSVMHTWSFLMTPCYGGSPNGQNSTDSHGGVHVFVDGVWLAMQANWGINHVPNTGVDNMAVTDYGSMPIIVGVDPAVPMSIDFIRVTQ